MTPPMSPPMSESGWESEGIPEVADDATPENARVDDPQQLAVPGERPTAVTDFGTTAAEQRDGESLDGRLAREVPDVAPVDTTRPRDVSDIDTDTDGLDPTLEPEPADEGARIGRLVEPDEGAHADLEKDAVATDSGDDRGLTPEESALHLERE